jgi:DtxR family transcriptional regulator, Mn-dependent transcriptional regulator
MSPITLSEKAEEILEQLWQSWTEQDAAKVDLKTVGTKPGDPAIDELLRGGFVEVKDKAIAITPTGHKRGEEIVRCHRLAERLLVDVLDMPEAAGDEAACKFEHILKRGLNDRICTLLGHPRFCPHGLPIPPGQCCKEKRESQLKIVSPLSALEEGEKGTIAYLHTRQKGRLERLLALGVLPGQPIALIQRFPSYVFRIGETEVAVDADLASHIYVRLGAEPPARRKWRRRGLLMR